MSDHLSYLVVLVPALLVMQLLVLHMGELYGWGLLGRLNALFDSVQLTLTTAGGGAGPLHVAGEVLWLLIDLIATVAIVFPLKVLQFLEVIIPDAPVLMGIAEGLGIAFVVVFVIACNPWRDYFKARKVINENLAQSAGMLQRDKKRLKDYRAALDRIHNSDVYREAVALWAHKEEELNARRPS